MLSFDARKTLKNSKAIECVYYVLTLSPYDKIIDLLITELAVTVREIHVVLLF